MPEVSVAVQVTVVVPAANAEPEGGTQTTDTPGQLSAETGAAKLTATLKSPALTVLVMMLAGQAIVGNCVSTTVTAKAQLDLLLTASETVHVTVVVPFAKVEPDGGVQPGAPTPGQLSLTTGALYVTTAEQSPSAAGAVILAGQAIFGGCESFTLTVNEQDDVLFEVSVAMHDTVVVPFGNADPDAGVHVAVTPGQLSFVVGVNVTTAEQRFRSVFLTILAGQVMAGA